jgi:hypothetical protein
MNHQEFYVATKRIIHLECAMETKISLITNLLKNVEQGFAIVEPHPRPPYIFGGGPSSYGSTGVSG